MIFLRFTFLLFLSLLLSCCNVPERNNEQDDLTMTGEKTVVTDSLIPEPEPATTQTTKMENPYKSVPDTGFVVMNKYAPGFAYDMKYATNDNFLNAKVYSCDQCLVRKEVADVLKEAGKKLKRRGLRIKFYDCYRPLDVQKKMWKIYPNPRYVANPNTTGSIHNRGGAVDITLVNSGGEELDMGTVFDHFGNEAHHAFTGLPDTVLANRRLLKETMESSGFNSITSEWWHYSFKSSGNYSLSNFSVECD